MVDSVQKRGVLAGRTIAIPETRELHRLSTLLADRGAKTLAYPMIDIRDVADPAPVTAWLHRLCAGDFHDLILMTGEGVTRLCGFAAQAGIHPETVAAISKARTITRGPKTARAP
jgi:uroporphyrinogen-III synthase